MMQSSHLYIDRVSGKLSVHPAANGHPTLFRPGGGLGGEGREDGHHPSHSVLSDTCGALNFHCPYGKPAMGLTFAFLNHLRVRTDSKRHVRSPIINSTNNLVGSVRLP